MKLRDYQAKLVNDTSAALKKHNSVVVQLPTGGGKTAIATNIVSSIQNAGKRVFFICHRSELVEQTAKTFNKIGLSYGFVANGWPEHKAAQIQICSIDTLKNRLDKNYYPDFCIFDEAHHCNAAGWAKVKDYYSQAKHIGLTATPTRLDGRGLGEHFQEMVSGPSVRWLMDNGFLSQYRLFCPEGVDLSGVSKIAGDYKKSELAELMDKPSITGDIVKHYLQHARGTRAIYFAVNVAHSEHIAEQFRKAGVMAVHLDGKSDKSARKSASKAFANGDIQVLGNVGLFGEGYDLAAQAGMDVTIETLIMARPTASLSLYLQMCGRPLRPKDKPAIIIDHAGNTARHGYLCEERIWTLDGERGANGAIQEKKEITKKTCDECYGAYKSNLDRCPYCGYKPESKAREIEYKDEDLMEVDIESIRNIEEIKKQDASEQGMSQSMEQLIKLGIKRGVKNPQYWAAKIYTSRKSKRGRI